MNVVRHDARYQSIQFLTIVLFGAVAVLAGIGIAIVPMMTLVLIVVATGAFVLGVWRPDLALAAIALSIPLQRLVMPGIGSSLFTMTKLVIWLSIAGWAIRRLIARDGFRVDAISLTMGLMVLVLAASIWNAEQQGYWIGETYRWFAALAVLIFAYDAFRRGASVKPFLLATAVGTLFTTAIAAWQVAMRIGPPSFEARGFFRASGPFGHPNQLAIYFELTLPLFAAILLYRLRLGDRIESTGIFDRRLMVLWGFAATAAVLGGAMTQSRGGGLGIAAGTAAVAFLALLPPARMIRLLVPTAFVVLIGGLAVGIWIAVNAGGRQIGDPTLVTTYNFAVQERLAHWLAAVNMAREYPYLGVGAGNFDERFRELTTNWRFRIGRGHAHNTYLQMLAQSGIVGFGAYLALFGTVGTILVQGLTRPKSPEFHAIAIGVAGITVAVLVHGFFEYVHVLSLPLQLAICWAFVGAGVVRNLKRSPAPRFSKRMSSLES
jgi:putative inorganic carbon (hco3(-)) transporter